MDIINEYLDLIQKIDSIPKTDASQKAIKQNNKFADRIRSIAIEIECKHPEMKAAFFQLLFHKSASVRAWCAHHILEVMNYDNDCKADALKEISYIATHDDGIHGFGNKIWLNNWFKDHPEDQILIQDTSTIQ